MRESKIEKYLQEQIENIGGECWKWSSPGKRGVPDRIILLPVARIYFVELKQKGKPLSKLQKVIKRILTKLGFDVRKIDSKKQVDNFIDELINVK